MFHFFQTSQYQKDNSSQQQSKPQLLPATAKHIIKYFPNYLQWQAHTYASAPLPKSHPAAYPPLDPALHLLWGTLLRRQGPRWPSQEPPAAQLGQAVAATTVPVILRQHWLCLQLQDSCGWNTTGKSPLQLQENPLHLTASARIRASKASPPCWAHSKTPPLPPKGQLWWGEGRKKWIFLQSIPESHQGLWWDCADSWLGWGRAWLWEQLAQIWGWQHPAMQWEAGLDRPNLPCSKGTFPNLLFSRMAELCTTDLWQIIISLLFYCFLQLFKNVTAQSPAVCQKWGQSESTCVKDLSSYNHYSLRFTRWNTRW